MRIYTEDAAALKAAIQKSPERMSVSEMMRGNPPSGKKEKPRMDMRRIARFLKDRMQDAYDVIKSRGPWQQRAVAREVRHEHR